MDPTSQSGLSHIYPLIASTQYIVNWNGSDLFRQWYSRIDVGTPEDWVHKSMKLQTWMDVYSHKIGIPPKKSKGTWHNKRGCPTKLDGSSEAAQRGSVPSETMPSQHVPSQPVPNQPVPSQPVVPSPFVPSQTIGNQVVASKSVATKVGKGTQASTGPTVKRTTTNASRLTLRKATK
ncbi:hypothetical protein Tco_1157343 [Tanacetum coccineum]